MYLQVVVGFDGVFGFFGHKEEHEAVAALVLEVSESDVGARPPTPMEPWGLAEGIQDIDYAPTGRAGCAFCSTKIALGEVRFEWFWAVRKPANKIHAGCASRMSEKFLRPSIASLDRLMVQYAADDILRTAITQCKAKLLQRTSSTGSGAASSSGLVR
jgi:hypothetical protein